MEVVLIKHRSESQWTGLLEYLTISTNVRCYYHVVYNDLFCLSAGSAPVHVAFNTVQLLQYKTLSFVSPELCPNNSTELN